MTPRPRRPPPRREADVLRACLDLLALRGVPHFRNNVGAVRVDGRYVRFGTKGCSDILAVVPFPGPHRGKLLCVETKRPGGKVSDDQHAFLARVRAAGGLAMVVDDVSDLAGLLHVLEGDR